MMTSVSITATEIDIVIMRGNDCTFEFILTDGRDEPIDITPDDVKLTVRDYEGGTLKIQKTNTPADHLDGPNGLTAFEILDSDITETQTSDDLTWVYEIRRLQPAPDSDQAVHIKGKFTVVAQVGA